MLISIISVSVLTSIITSDMVDYRVALHNEQVVVVQDSWEDFLARLLVNRARTSQNILKVYSYTELFDALATNQSLEVGLVDHYILGTMQDEISSKALGENSALFPNL